jgi:hypothetical protein
VSGRRAFRISAPFLNCDRLSVNAGRNPRLCDGEDAVLSSETAYLLRRAEADNLPVKEQLVVESVGRMFLCARCRERTVLCSRCDRGQIYCGQSCSRAARVEAQQAAGQRYQSSDIGRVNHVERTRKWRLRQKERGPGAQDAGSCVTHQGSQQAPTAAPVLPSSLLASVEPSAATEAAQTHWFCSECAAALHPWVRLGFVIRRRARASLRSARARPSKGATDAGTVSALASIKAVKPRPHQRIDADLHQR